VILGDFVANYCYVGAKQPATPRCAIQAVSRRLISIKPAITLIKIVIILKTKTLFIFIFIFIFVFIFVFIFAFVFVINVYFKNN
jgi:hypothetical protein